MLGKYPASNASAAIFKNAELFNSLTQSPLPCTHVGRAYKEQQ